MSETQPVLPGLEIPDPSGPPPAPASRPSPSAAVRASSQAAPATAAGRPPSQQRGPHPQGKTPPRPASASPAARPASQPGPQPAPAPAAEPAPVARRAENPVHAAYRALIESREVRRLAERFGLDRGIRYELVDQRRSFHGKAGIVNGLCLVRLPSNPRPEAYLLLTLLHEWAHLLAQRNAKGCRIPPHGSDWRRYYSSLVHAAVKAKLFPGNEQEVIRHAAAGEAGTRHARLCGPDGQPLVPPAEKQTPRFRVGDAVQFTDKGGQMVTGTVRRINARTYTVAAAEGNLIYRVPIAYPALVPAGEAPPEPEADTPWRRGVSVEFVDQTGERHQGHVVRVNLRTLTVRTEAGKEFRVGYKYPSLRRLTA